MAHQQASLLRTPLYQVHRSLAARMVPFGGWEMPLQYTGILAEARAVRGGLGLFDVSHMGRLRFEGPGSPALLDYLCTADVGGLAPGRARYGLLLLEDGGVLDDVVVYRLPGQERAGVRLGMVCNAANRPAVLGWLGRHASSFPGVRVVDVTLETAMVAAQGPGAARAVGALAPGEEGGASPLSMRPFGVGEWVLRVEGVVGIPALVSRTGYTGEDGFELVVEAGRAAPLWGALAALGGEPCGLGARDVLRLEAGLRLHGVDMDPGTTALEAGLERFVAMEKGAFVGREALLRQRATGVRRRLVGLAMEGRGIPRRGYPVLAAQGVEIGAVTSGCHSPALDTDIGMGYVAAEHSGPGTRLFIDVRGRRVPARVVGLPFYRRPSA